MKRWLPVLSTTCPFHASRPVFLRALEAVVSPSEHVSTTDSYLISITSTLIHMPSKNFNNIGYSPY